MWIKMWISTDELDEFWQEQKILLASLTSKSFTCWFDDVEIAQCSSLESATMWIRNRGESMGLLWMRNPSNQLELNKRYYWSGVNHCFEIRTDGWDKHV